MGVGPWVNFNPDATFRFATLDRSLVSPRVLLSVTLPAPKKSSSRSAFYTSGILGC